MERICQRHDTVRQFQYAIIITSNFIQLIFVNKYKFDRTTSTVFYKLKQYDLH